LGSFLLAGETRAARGGSRRRGGYGLGSDSNCADQGLTRFVVPAMAPFEKDTDQHGQNHDAADAVKDGAAFPFELISKTIKELQRPVAKLIVLQFARPFLLIFCHWSVSLFLSQVPMVNCVLLGV